MAVIPVQDFVGGILDDLDFNAANSGGDTVVGGTGAGGWHLPVYLVVNNGHSSPQTVTVAGTGEQEIADATIAVIRVHGGYGQAAAAVTYSGVTAMTVAAFRDRS
jgi:hypothetical protein